ncbi:MAG TPA: PASTA domain-containing protein, partial [Actinomycetota bacterium]|nr:PASTA domain-containing protein [Actinomycetota bacterium]
MRGALVPREASGRRAHHVLTLINAGNASLEPAVRVVDENNALVARVDPAFPAFPPGRSQKVDVYVRPRRRKWVGAAQTYRYRVVAHEDGVAPVELDASLTQRAFVPGWAVRLAALAAPLAAAVIAFVMLWTVVPEVEGLPAAAAVEDLEEAGLESTVVRRHSATVEEGTVLGSEPEGGIRVREGSKVKLFVSSGPRPVPIPNVVGLDAASARLELSSMGLAIEEKAEESEEVEPGLVVATRPVANLLVPPGSKVQMIVAAPPEGKGGKGAEDEGSGSGSDGGGAGSEEDEAGGEDEERGRGGRAPYWTSSVASNDFDGDGAADLALFRPSTGAWHVRFGPGRVRTVDWARQRGNDVPVPGDYDGDGSTDFATWRPSDATWYVRYAGSKGHEVAELGRPGDVPVPGDYDGDGRTDMAAFGADDGRWRIRPSSGDGSGVRDVEWGDRSLGDLPVPGDYDGDGRTDLAYYRASTGRWRVAFGAGGTEAVRWGDPLEGDVPVPGDYDGDGTHDYAVWRPPTGEWRIRPSGRGDSLFVTWGRRDLLDVPVPGDYTGDGTFDLAVWRESTRAWRIRPAEGTKRRIHYWGRAGDVPL